MNIGQRWVEEAPGVFVLLRPAITVELVATCSGPASIGASGWRVTSTWGDAAAQMYTAQTLAEAKAEAERLMNGLRER